MSSTTERLLASETNSVERLIAMLKEARAFIANNSFSGGPSITPILKKIDKTIDEA